MALEGARLRRRRRFIIKLIPHSQHVWKSECLRNSWEKSVSTDHCATSTHTHTHMLLWWWLWAARYGWAAPSHLSVFFDLIMPEAYFILHTLQPLPAPACPVRRIVWSLVTRVCVRMWCVRVYIWVLIYVRCLRDLCASHMYLHILIKHLECKMLAIYVNGLSGSLGSLSLWHFLSMNRVPFGVNQQLIIKHHTLRITHTHTHTL